MDPEEKIPEIPYQTPERIEDPPGGYLTIHPKTPPKQNPSHNWASEVMRRMRTRVKILLLKINITRTNQECLLILKLFGCLQNPIDQ